MTHDFRAGLGANPVFCALDTPDLDQALALGRGLGSAVGGLKLGLEFFSAQGPAGVAAVARLGRPLFLDLKLHDIPNTVAAALKALAPLKPALINVHAGGGPAMLAAAAGAVREQGPARPLLLGVTVLTSLDAADLTALGVGASPLDHAIRLARLCKAQGLDGVVCSAGEIAAVRAACGADFLIVVPGIRPHGAASGDQKRMATPAEAIAAGANVLVIGRPITGAADPAVAARAIAAGLGGSP
jgi:orotidine-5'-phosphate decarboxylase